MTRLPPDQSARNAIRSDFSHNMIVRAGAGSGKTSALVDRVVALVSHGEDPSAIVAITFTRKAAAEMRGRIYDGLAKAARNATDPEENDRLNEALGRADELYVGTIHAFCSRILAQAPWVAGLPSDFRQIEDDEERVLRARFWRGFLTTISQDSRMADLLDAGCSNAVLFDLFGKLAEFANWTPYTDTDAAPPEFSEAIARARDAQTYLEGLKGPGPGRDDVQKTLDRLRIMEHARPLDTPGAQAAWLSQFSRIADTAGTKLRITLKHWEVPGGIMKAIRDGIPHDEVPIGVLDVITRTIRPALSGWGAWIHRLAVEVLMTAVDAYDALRRSSGQLTYADLVRLAADVLESDMATRTGLQQRVRRVLVDEFQDTDPTQARMLFFLASEAPDPEDWARSPLLPGRLLFVGDDKQSIYRFRQADFQVFARCEEAILAQGGRSLLLQTNFRSTPAICDWVNGAVAPLFDPGEGQAPWQDLVAFQPPADAGPVDQLVLPSGLLVADEVSLETRAIAARIRALHAESVPYGQMLILVRRNSRIPRFVATLSAAGIPVTVSGGAVSGGSDVLASVSAILSALARPDDPLACVAAFVSPLLGVSHDDLAAHHALGGVFDWRVSPPDSGPASIASAVALMARATALFETHPPHTALATLVASEGWWALLRSRASGPVDIGVMHRILALVRRRQRESADWVECTAELGRYASGELEMNLHAIQADDADSVRIMTVHQAKGLEAEVVFLADPGRPHAHAQTSHTFSEGGTSYVVLPAIEQAGFHKRVVFAPARWEEWAARERAMEQAEAMRLLYVACTRARTRLVVTTRDGGRQGAWDLFAPALSRAEAPSTVVTDIAMPGVPDRPSGPAFPLLTDEVRRRITTPSYEVVRPSDVDHDEGASIQATRRAEGRDRIGGKQFGSAVHAALEHMILARHGDVDASALDDWARQALRASGVFPVRQQDADAVAACLRGFRAGPLWEEIRQADDVLAEVPFTTDLGSRIISGTVDLAYRRGTAWTLVDYKTDVMRDTAELLERYGGQLRTYRQCWRRMFEDDSVRTLLWSTDQETAIQVD